MRAMMIKTSARQCKWLLKIILQDLKISLSVDRALKDFHPDAVRCYNM
jgi:hypothetical protein